MPVLVEGARRRPQPGRSLTVNHKQDDHGQGRSNDQAGPESVPCRRPQCGCQSSTPSVEDGRCSKSCQQHRCIRQPQCRPVHIENNQRPDPGEADRRRKPDAFGDSPRNPHSTAQQDSSPAQCNRADCTPGRISSAPAFHGQEEPALLRFVHCNSETVARPRCRSCLEATAPPARRLSAGVRPFAIHRPGGHAPRRRMAPEARPVRPTDASTSPSPTTGEPAARSGRRQRREWRPPPPA
jgi:hypothetical protein